jgi:hypothetical protein
MGPFRVASLAPLFLFPWLGSYGCSSEDVVSPNRLGGSGGSSAATSGSTADSGGSTSSVSASTSGGSQTSSGGSPGSGGTSGNGGGSAGDDASGGSGGARGGMDASAGAGGTGGLFDPDAGYGCGDAGLPGFCDNGVRVRPPTGNATIDALLKLTPEACAKKVSKHSYKMDLDRNDPDNRAGLQADICGLNGAVYWVADMDIDCDGHTTPGKCDKAHDCCYLEDTNVHGPNGALTAAEDPYVVIPIDFACPGEPTFPDFAGLKAGATVAVIYANKILYAPFGDCGPPEIIGEASYAAAERLGIPPSAVNGGALGRTVTYIVFTGDGTVAKNITDEAEVKALGEQLAAKLVQNNP